MSTCIQPREVKALISEHGMIAAVNNNAFVVGREAVYQEAVMHEGIAIMPALSEMERFVNIF